MTGPEELQKLRLEPIKFAVYWCGRRVGHTTLRRERWCYDVTLPNVSGNKHKGGFLTAEDAAEAMVKVVQETSYPVCH